MISVSMIIPKTFDKVKHRQLLDMLQDLDIDGGDIRLLRNLYWQQIAGMRSEDGISNLTDKERSTPMRLRIKAFL